jgi:Fe-S cluster biogenesis protein NfuA
MAASMDDQSFQQRMERLEVLLQEVEQFADPQARTRTRDIVQAILDLHSAALDRMLQRVADAPEAGFTLIDALGRDDLVGSVLLLHGLHPLDLEARVRQALEKVRQSIRSQGGAVELLRILDGVVHLRVQGSCDSCASSAHALKLSIEEAIYQKAPDAIGIEIEEVTAGPPTQNGHTRIALPLLRG